VALDHVSGLRRFIVPRDSALHRWTRGATVGLALLIVLLFLLSSAGVTIGSPIAALSRAASSSRSSVGFAPPAESADHGVLTHCLVGYAYVDAYDPADGYIYVLGANWHNGQSAIFVVKPPCTQIKTIDTGNGDYSDLVGVAYDPLTKEMVVTDIYAGEVYVLQGTSIVKTVSTPSVANGGGNLAWDGAIGSILIPDEFGVTVLHLKLVNGKTKATVHADRFDKSNASFGTGNIPISELVADGYIFSAGHRVRVFNDRTFAYVGAFNVGVGGIGNVLYYGSLVWNPTTHTIVMGGGNSVILLDAKSIASHKFTYRTLSYHAFQRDWVFDVAYSPATRQIYVTVELGAEVFKLSDSGKLTHVYLGKVAVNNLTGLAYDPVNHEMYVCSSLPPALYVIR
jgi:DNA-binding beta-propeller fold protein YncE